MEICVLKQNLLKVPERNDNHKKMLQVYFFRITFGELTVNFCNKNTTLGAFIIKAAIHSNFSTIVEQIDPIIGIYSGMCIMNSNK